MTLLGALCSVHTQLGQEAAVVGLHPFLGQPTLAVVPEGADHFPIEVLPGGLDWTDGRNPDGMDTAVRFLPTAPRSPMTVGPVRDSC